MNQSRPETGYESLYQTSKISALDHGLSTRRSIIRDHNGALFLNSAVSKGAAFVIELPVYQQHDNA